MLPQGSQASFQVAKGTSGFLWSRCRGIGPHLELRSSYERDLWVLIQFQQVSQASSHVEAWNSTFLSSCKSGIRPPVEFRRGTWAFSRGAKRK